jgi:hypothetical protein
VKAFMGEDHEVAHVPAEAQTVLADFDKRPAYYEVLDRRDQPQRPFRLRGRWRILVIGDTPWPAAWQERRSSSY